MDDGQKIEGKTGLRPRRFTVVAGITAVVLVSAAVAASSSPAAGWFGRRHGGHWGGAPHDPAQAREHAEHAARWLLRSVDASDEQQEQVNAVIGKLVEGTQALALQHDANREAFIDQLSGATVDRAALHRIREAELELAVTASRQLVEALADVAEILTAQQRSELIDAAQHFRH